MDYVTTMANLNDAVIHFNRKREYGELTYLDQHAVIRDFRFAFGLLLDAEYSRAQNFINRANATMNATAH